jgi:S1-C subfamily serine protease
MLSLPSGSLMARLGNSGAVRVGEQVMVVGAPYGLAYSISVGWIGARWARNPIFPDMLPGGILSDHGYDQHG